MKEILYYFLLFIIYSFIGWLYESILCSITERKIINRGFLNGPFCPVYGSGAVFVVLFLGRLTNPFEVFILSILLTGILEYFTSYVMEKLFNAKWWDYSTRRFNIHGRVCLLGAFVFGCMSLLVIFIVNPFITKELLKVNKTVLYISALIIFIGLSIDLAFTVNSLLYFNKKLSNIQDEINKYFEKAKSNFIEESKIKREKFKENLMEVFEESEFYSEKIKSMLNTKKFQEKRILTAFPHFKSTKYHEAFEKFKNTMKKK